MNQHNNLENDYFTYSALLPSIGSCEQRYIHDENFYRELITENEKVATMIENGQFDGAAIRCTEMMRFLINMPTQPFFVSSKSMENEMMTLFPTTTSESEISSVTATRSPIVTTVLLSCPFYASNDKTDRLLHDQLMNKSAKNNNHRTNLIFRQPLLLNYLGENGYHYSYDQLLFCLCYNMALSIHLGACMRNDKEGLYQCSELWQELFAWHSQPNLELTITHTLAILTNLGHVHALQGHDKSSLRFYEKLYSTICLVRSKTGALQMHDKFFLSVALEILVWGNLAPAA